MSFPQPQGSWITTLRELITLAERDAFEDAPPVSVIRARIPYWLEQILALLDKTAELGIVAQGIGEGREGRVINFTQGSPRTQDFFNFSDSDTYGRSLLAWYASAGALGQLDQNGLPIFDDESPIEVFPIEFINDQEAFLVRVKFKGIDKIVQCMHDFNDYEHLGPSHGKDGAGAFTDMLELRFLLFPEHPFSENEGEIENYVLLPVPSGFSTTRGANFEEIHGILVPNWFRHHPFTHKASGTLYGGLNGGRIGLLMILRLLHHVYEDIPNEPEEVPGSSPDQPPSMVLPKAHLISYINQCLHELQKELRESMESLRTKVDHRRLSLVYRQQIDGLPTVPDSQASPRILRTEQTDQALRLFREATSQRRSVAGTHLGTSSVLAEPQPSGRSASEAPRSIAGSSRSPAHPLSIPNDPPSTHTAAGLKFKPASAVRGPRKSVSDPQLAAEPMYTDTGIDQPKTLEPVISSRGPPFAAAPEEGFPRPDPVPVVHSPPSTEGRGRQPKRTRPNLDPAPKDTDKTRPTTGRSRGKSVSGKSRSDVDHPEAHSEQLAMNTDMSEAPRPRTRSGQMPGQPSTSRQQSVARPRAPSAASVVTDNPPPLEPSADSSWAAPIRSTELDFDMFAGAAVKKGGKSGKGASAPPEGQGSTSTGVATRAAAARADTNRRKPKKR